MEPFRTVLWWQAVTTAVMALIAGFAGGMHGATSAGLGGLVGIIGCLAFAVVASLHKRDSAGSVLIAALRAEAVKIVVIVALLWLVLTTYKEAMVVGFIAAFTVSIVIFSMAVWVRDK
jgi:ATP synthase protein I